MQARRLSPGDARDRALRALVESYDGQAVCHDLLQDWQAADPLSPADAALAAELAIGVSRRRITCEHVAAHFYRGRWPGLRIPVRIILALGVYQLCWLDRIPVHAAIDQAVRQARRYGRGAADVVNAVLRHVADCCGESIQQPSEPDPRRYLPIDSQRGRLFTENVFPDPARRPLEHLVAVTAHPPWLVERWHRRFKPALCREICDAGLRRPPLVLRPNAMRSSAGELLDRLADSGHSAQLSPDGASVIFPDSPPVALLPEFARGLCQPQDATSQLALKLSPPRPGEFILDYCAGLGTKSTQAAEMMNDSGIVLATDMNPSKLDGVRSSARRLGLSIIRTAPLDQLDAALKEIGRPPDVLLLDVPCLNTGVLARRPEARYRAGARALRSIVQTQRGILCRAEALIRSAESPGRRIGTAHDAPPKLIYSTCSLEAEENEDQVVWFCTAFPGWRIHAQQFTTPAALRDGGFAAVVVRDS